VEGYGIKTLTRTQIPNSHIVVAVESRLGGDRAGYEQTWRVGAFNAWRTHKGRTISGPQQSVQSVSELWVRISDCAGTRGVTFLWCHDLSWVARVSAAFIELPKLGWQLDAFNLVPGSGWLVWRKGRCTLKFFDTMSVWQTSLDRLGQLFGEGRKLVPPMEARPEIWMSRVWQDMKILTKAVTSYLEWIRHNDLGTLAVTGSGQAWAAFRRRFLSHGILVHSDPELRAMEREAMWAGRAEAYWHGAILTQQVDEWDFTNAYNTIGRTRHVPVYPDMPIDPDTNPDWLTGWKRHEPLAEVEIETLLPVVPCRVEGGIVWPTGRFVSTLWGPEIREALRAGATVRIRKGWLYRCAPVLHEWASWISGQLGGTGDPVPTWVQLILKRWSNTLIGRFGMRYPEWEIIGESIRSDAFAIPMWDMDSDEMSMLMQAGHRMFEQTGVSEPRYSAPMITGYVMSAMRARLWRLMGAMPQGALLYVDTDSVLTTDAWRIAMEAIRRQPDFEGLRLKRSWDGFAIYGPRQIVTGHEVRFSGLPKSAERVGRHDFEGEVVESLEQALGHNALDRVRISRKRWTVEGKDTRRQGPATGWTDAHHVDLLGDNNVSVD
jgi:hypothetical protein